MAQVIPHPDPQSLLPPLLACLPTSFASSRPPPALLSLLSPILRQRLNIFTSAGSEHDSWLRLLCWDSAKAERLKETVENADFEPHPASGELEVGDIERVSYKRFDSETLKGQLPLVDWSLSAPFLWCTGSEEGDAWRLTELLPYDSDLSQDPSWSSSPSEANERAESTSSNLAVQEVQGARADGGRLSVPGQDEEDDDDAYWAQYDKTPNTGTPARQASIKPAEPGASEAEYYARYGDVQPAMDNYDPDEYQQGMSVPSTLNGGHVDQVSKDNPHFQPQTSEHVPQQAQNASRLHIPDEDDVVHVSHPVPSSPSSRAGSETVAKLELTADRYSATEIAIKQHISYSIKSMYRLAKGASITRQDFEDMVQRELETLSMLDRED